MITLTDRMVTRLKRVLLFGFALIGVLQAVILIVLVYGIIHGGPS